MTNHTSNRVRTFIRVFHIIIGGFCLIILGRIFYLQIIEYETYERLGENNYIRQEYVEPARGLIYDRNGILLVENQPIYSLTVTPANFDRKNLPFLGELLGISDSLLTSRINAATSYSRYRKSKFITDIDFKTFTEVQENLWRLPGIKHHIDSKRNYPSNVMASHVMGYLREASEAEYRASPNLRLGDRIGKSGIELMYNNELTGEFGLDYVRVNALGQTLGSFEVDREPKEPVQGNNLITTIDSELQAFTEELMKGKIGAAVAMNPNTGEILALVSSPYYEVNRLAGNIDTEYWQSINSDSLRPLFNRAVSSRQPPGSTFKPVMGIVGLHLGIVKPETEIYNSGAYIRGRPYQDLADVGNYDLEKAIAFSSNTYFLYVMDRLTTTGKLDQWSKLIKDFGLGVQTPIDLPSVTSGIIPDSLYMNSRFGVRKWGLGDILNFGIGQGLVSASPLQIAQMTSTISNGGYKIKPHILKAVQKQNGDFENIPIEREKIEWIKQSYLEPVKKGMRRVVIEGSARVYGNTSSVEIAGKTGTAQNSQGFDHGWFTSFAPIENPEIVVTVFIENGGFGSISAAPVASLMIEKYMTGEINRQWVYNYVMSFVPREANSRRNE